jgi:hypothetical protein
MNLLRYGEVFPTRCEIRLLKTFQFIRINNVIPFTDWATGWTVGVQFPEGLMMVYFLFATVTRPALGHRGLLPLG